MVTSELAPNSVGVGIHYVLIGTDLSHQSERAIRYGLDFARLLGAEAEIVYVLPTEEYVVAGPEGLQAARDAARRDLLELRSSISSRSSYDDNAGFHVAMCEGAVAECLLQHAGDKKADLIVLGTHGRGGLGKALLGSVAEKIFRRSRVPVLTVGPNAQRQHEVDAIREIVAPCDLTDGSHSAVWFACGMAASHHSRLTVLHVVDGGSEAVRIDPERAEACIRDRLSAAVGEHGHGVDVFYRVESGRIAPTVLDVSAERHADLIVLGVRPSSGILDRFAWPIAYEVVRGASCPVLTLRGRI